MAVTGAILLMARYKAIKLQAAENWEDEYKISMQQVQLQKAPVEIVEEPKTPRVKKVSKSTTKSSAVKKATASKATAKTPTLKKKPATRTKKSSSE